MPEYTGARLAALGEQLPQDIQALTSAIREALNAVSGALTTQGLQKMNKRVTVDKTDPAQVAHDWVEQHADDLSD